MVDFSNFAVPRPSAYLSIVVKKENLLSPVCVCTCVKIKWYWSVDINRGKTTGKYE